MLHGGVTNAVTSGIDAGADVVGGDGKGWFPNSQYNSSQPVESALDHAAGSTDEWIGRTAGNVPNRPVESTLDWAAGSTDETVGRHTDGRVVEGFADWAAGSADEAVGKTAKGIQQFGSNMMLLGFGFIAVLGLIGFGVITT